MNVPTANVENVVQRRYPDGLGPSRNLLHRTTFYGLAAVVRGLNVSATVVPLQKWKADMSRTTRVGALTQPLARTGPRP
jgi:hypothetical protein